MLKSEIRTSREILLDMHRTSFPKIIIFLTFCLILPPAVVFGRASHAGEIAVTKCWAYTTGDGVGLASDGDLVFLGAAGAKIEALSFDGKKIWSSDLGGDFSSNILPLGSGVVVVTSTVSSGAEKPGGSILRSLSKETGITNWALKLPDAERHFVGRFNGAVVVVSNNGVIQSIDAKSGTVKWKREITEGFVAEPIFTGVKVLVASAGKQIFGVSLGSGEIESLRKVPFGVTALGETSTHGLVVGDERGNFSSMANGTEKADWKFKSGGEISNIITFDDHLLVASHDNFVYFIASRNGDLAWKKRLSGRVSQLGNIFGQYVFIAGFEEHNAVFTDIASGRVAGQIQFGEEENLVVGPVFSSGVILLLTDKAAYLYSLNGCIVNRDGGANKEIPRPPV